LINFFIFDKRVYTSPDYFTAVFTNNKFNLKCLHLKVNGLVYVNYSTIFHNNTAALLFKFLSSSGLIIFSKL